MQRKPQQRPTVEVPGRGFSAWGVLAAVLVLLVATCVLWAFRVGVMEALASTGFQYLLVAIAIVGVLVGGRVTMRSLREETRLDGRNVMDWSRSGLWKPWEKP
ncbi:MAG: hypothetical protein IT538_08800 [Variibacter sp.]|nr:hypothetical protein [Variibacter sp.]